MGNEVGLGEVGIGGEFGVLIQKGMELNGFKDGNDLGADGDAELELLLGGSV